ncbi:MAG: hydrogenase iron-sulfur subunit [Dehalococcoidia bacterium]
MSFEPKIVGFLCNWCSYAGADLAGVARMKCVPNVHIIRTMCSGGVSPAFILKAFQAGADGVLICGCNPGDCHYREGNYKAVRRVTLLKKVLERLGIEEQRLQLHWVCASCGDEFVEVVNNITAELKELGPLRAGEMEV